MFELTARTRSGRARSKYVCTSGEQIDVAIVDPSRAFRIIDRAYFALGLVALGGCWLPFVLPTNTSPWGSLIWLVVLGCGLIVRGTKTRPLLSDALQKTRPAIVYLRSFADDDSLLRQALREKRELGENDLVAALEQHASVLAIGRPGEPLPPEGAVRIYVDDSHWKAVVGDLIQRVRAVVLRPGASEGLRWELTQVISANCPLRLVLFIPESGGWLSTRHQTYSEFRRWANSIFPRPLPVELGSSSIVYFHSKWTPSVLKPGQTVFVDCEAETADPPVDEFAVVPCSGCGTQVHPTTGGACPSCGALFHSTGNSVACAPHPLEPELRSLAVDPEMFSARSSAGRMSWLTRPIRIPCPRWLKSFSYFPKLVFRLLGAMGRATYRLRAVLGNCLAIGLCGVIVFGTIAVAPVTGRRAGRSLRLSRELLSFFGLQDHNEESPEKSEADRRASEKLLRLEQLRNRYKGSPLFDPPRAGSRPDGRNETDPEKKSFQE